MESHEAVEMIETELGKHDIYPVSRNRAWPDSLYFGGHRPDLYRIRVSDHEKGYTPRHLEITILVKDGMTKDEVLAGVHDAVQELTQEEHQLFQDEGND